MKLTKEERNFLNVLEDDYVYIARSSDGYLSLFNDEPSRDDKNWYLHDPECENVDFGILINKASFPFITWESGKAWSKSELMELEVIYGTKK